MPEAPSFSERQQRLERVVADYLHAVEAGQGPDQAELLKQYPELADDLSSFFRNRAAMERMADPIKQQAAALAETIGPSEATGAGSFVRYFGDYELVEEIARGGMGVVFRARQVSLNRIVAVKMILAGQLASSGEVQRFKIEAEAAAGLDHPNIVPIYEVGEHEGQHYFSMKLVEGGSLGQLMAGPQWPVRTKDVMKKAVELMIALAGAVHHAHQRGILHRDLKPANVLLQRAEGGRMRDEKNDGELSDSSFITHPSSFHPTITDFGLAKRVTGAKELTQSGAMVGTPAYMAPEQVRAEKRLTTAVDIYGLGAIFYEMLTGRAPFQGTTPFDTLTQVLEQDSVPPRNVRPDLDPDLETICLKCLHKQADSRYASAAALADDLQRWQQAEPILGRRAGRVERASKWVRRNKGLSAGLAAAILALVVGTAVSTWLAVEAVAQANIAQEQEQEAKKQAKIAKESEDKARRGLFTTQLARVESLLVSDPVRARQLLHDKDMCPADLRDFAWRLYDRACQRELKSWPHVSQGAWSSLSGDGQALAGKARYNGLVRVWNIGAGQLYTFRNANATRLALSDDGKTLAWAVQDGTVKLCDVPTGTETATVKGHQGGNALAFSGDGHILASGGGSGIVKLWDIPAGTERAPLKALQQVFAGMGPLAFSRDGRMLAAADWSGAIHYWDVPEGRLRGSLQTKAGKIHFLAFSADGATLVSVGENDRTVRLWDVETGQPRAALEVATDTGTLLAFSGDGRIIASAAPQGNTVKLWDIRAGRVLATLEAHNRGVKSLAFRGDGRILASGGWDGTVNLAPATVKLWDVPAGRLQATLKVEGMETLAFSSDGKTLACGNYFWQTELWDVNTRSLRASLASNRTAVRSLVFTEDGQALASVYHDGTICLRSMSDGTEHDYLGSAAGPTTMAMSADRHIRATADLEGTIKLWDIPGRKEVASIPGPKLMISSLTFSGDGRTLASGEWDGTVNLWDARSGRLRDNLEKQDGGVRTLKFSDDGQTLAVGGGRGAITLWDVQAGKRRAHALDGHEGAIGALAFSADGKTLASGSSVGTDGTVRLWDVKAGRLRDILRGHSGAVHSITFSADGLTLAAGDEYGAKLWDIRRGQLRASLVGLLGNDGAALALAFSGDGKSLASEHRGGIVRLWDVQEGLGRTALQVQPSHKLVFSDDGKTIASGNLPGNIELWDVWDGGRRIPLKERAQGSVSLAMSGDGQVLAFAGDDSRTVTLWDVRAGKRRASLEGGGGIVSLAMSGDGRTLASGARGAVIKVWDAQTGKERATINGHEGWWLALSGDGKTLVSAGGGPVTKVWDIPSGKLRLSFDLGGLSSLALSGDGRMLAWGDAGGWGEGIGLIDFKADLGSATGHINLYDGGRSRFTLLRGGTGNVISLAFSDDGQTLASGSSDGTVRLWDVTARQVRATLKGHTSRVVSVRFINDGQSLISGSSDGTIRLWDAPYSREN